MQKTTFTIADILGKPLSEEEAYDLLRSDLESYRTYLTFPEEERQKLLSFVMGKRGLLITYDAFFKQIMNPDLHLRRLERFLGAIMGQTVKIRGIIPREGSKLTERGSLVIADIVVELLDGSIVNVEMQKIGHAFPGERSSCYISDFIMRQYNKVKSERQKKFSFKDMKPVYMIILLEHSSEEFRAVYPAYIHRQQTDFDSGAKVHLLSNILYISLDTFREVIHNIDTELEAWLTFLSAEEEEQILRLVNAYPEFCDMYHEIVEFRRDPRRLINMYSEALAIMDRNNVEYMCEEMKKTINEQAEQIAALQKEIERLEKEAAEKS